MERLRGAARATMPRSQKAMFNIGAAVMDPLLIFLEAYKNQVLAGTFKFSFRVNKLSCNLLSLPPILL